MSDSLPEGSYERVKAVKDAHLQSLLAMQNVVGCGIGYRQVAGKRTETMAIVVMVREKMPGSQLSTEDVIPTEIEGIPVDVQEVGEIRAG
jgi:hypothetical protein